MASRDAPEWAWRLWQAIEDGKHPFRDMARPVNSPTPVNSPDVNKQPDVNSDRKAYMRDYMRKRRQSGPE